MADRAASYKGNPLKKSVPMLSKVARKNPKKRARKNPVTVYRKKYSERPEGKTILSINSKHSGVSFSISHSYSEPVLRTKLQEFRKVLEDGGFSGEVRLVNT